MFCYNCSRTTSAASAEPPNFLRWPGAVERLAEVVGVCGLGIEGVFLLTIVGFHPLACFSIAGGVFGPGAEGQS